jgi:hypothetical protein
MICENRCKTTFETTAELSICNDFQKKILWRRAPTKKKLSSRNLQGCQSQLKATSSSSTQTGPNPEDHPLSNSSQAQVLTPIQSGYALARLLVKLPSLNGTFASPKLVFVNAVRAAAVRLSQAISGC